MGENINKIDYLNKLNVITENNNEKEEDILKYCHQIWWQGEKSIPLKYKPFCEKWKKLHEGVIYEFWDENRIRILIENELNWFLNTWESINEMIIKIDTSKIVILYLRGGWYCDMDMEPMKDVRHLLKGKKLVFSQTPVTEAILLRKISKRLVKYVAGVEYFSFMLINNAFMGGEKNHFIFMECLKNIKRNLESLDRRNYLYPSWVANIAGPELLCKTLYQNSKKLKQLNIYLPEYFEPKKKLKISLSERRKKEDYYITKNTVVIHYYTFKWITDSDSYITHAKLCMTLSWIPISALLILVIIITAIVYSFLKRLK